jgi:hypothetical protein
MTTEYPHIEETSRPYRIWDCKAKQDVRWKYYADPKRAVMGALLTAAWGEVGIKLEVYDTTNGKCYGIIYRRVKSIDFVRYV